MLFFIFFFTEETVSLESPPPENGGHNLSEIISTVLPEAAEDKLFAQRAPGSQLRNGSITVSVYNIELFNFKHKKKAFFLSLCEQARIG